MTTKLSTWRLLTGIVYFGHRPAVLIALGIAIAETQGYESAIMQVAALLFVAHNCLMLFVDSKNTSTPATERRGGFVELHGTTMKLTGEDAQQVHEMLQSLASKHQREREGSLQ